MAVSSFRGLNIHSKADVIYENVFSLSVLRIFTQKRLYEEIFPPSRYNIFSLRIASLAELRYLFAVVIKNQ